MEREDFEVVTWKLLPENRVVPGILEHSTGRADSKGPVVSLPGPGGDHTRTWVSPLVPSIHDTLRSARHYTVCRPSTNDLEFARVCMSFSF